MENPDPTANPGAENFDENGEPIKAPSNINEEKKADMDNIWFVFDTENKGKVPISELKTILRALDVKDLDDDLIYNEILKRADPEGTNEVSRENLDVVMEEELRDKHTKEDLQEQFNVLDKNKDGKIPLPEFKQYMTQLGHQMSDQEYDDFIEYFKIKDEVDIEDLAD